jgi:predicted transcriptional regulator
MNDTMQAATAAPPRLNRAVPMTLADVRAAIGADVIWGPDLTAPVTGVVAADLMSDVLVDARPGCVLVTGLANVQTIRTAVIADLAAVVFARGKAVPPEVLELARESKVPVFRSQRSLFEAAGRLYATLAGRPAEAGEQPET